MKKLLFLILLPILWSAQTDTVIIQQLQASTWPETITFDKLTVKKEHFKQSYNTKKPLFLTEKVKIETKMYNTEGPTGHGLYTTVYYLFEQEVFYIHSDCEMGHADGFIGPFKGNPKQLLAKN
jgi:hypothetical protein